MPDPSIMEQARYVINSITTIRDYISNQHMRCVGAEHENSRLNSFVELVEKLDRRPPRNGAMS